VSDVGSINERYETSEGVGDASVGDFWALLKPRVMSLVIFTALVGLVLAPGQLHPVLALTALMCIAIGAGASGALNMWYDADIDAMMSRTAKRPVPAGRVTPGEALGFGLMLSVGSVLILGLMVDWLAASLLAFTIFFYAVVYTMWLKRSTPQNIVIGGAAGALPPVIAWAAVTGRVDLAPLSLFLLIFLWTPPHFWALAVLKTGDYARAGVPMLPVVAGERATRWQILLYSVLLVPAGVLPAVCGIAGMPYVVVSLILGFAFVWFAVEIVRADGQPALAKACGRLFGYSILYLFAMFAMLLVERAAGVAPLPALIGG
jgi:protoheme IX farnesyltransferase